MFKSYEWAIWFFETEYILAKNRLIMSRKIHTELGYRFAIDMWKMETLCLRLTYIYLHTPIQYPALNF